MQNSAAVIFLPLHDLCRRHTSTGDDEERLWMEEGRLRQQLYSSSPFAIVVVSAHDLLPLFFFSVLLLLLLHSLDFVRQKSKYKIFFLLHEFLDSKRHKQLPKYVRGTNYMRQCEGERGRVEARWAAALLSFLFSFCGRRSMHR